MPKKKSITVSGQKFDSRKELQTWCYAVIHGSEELIEASQPVLVALVQKYDKTQDYLNMHIGERVESVFFAVPGADYPLSTSPCMHVKLSNGVSFTVGYRKVIDAAYDPERAKLVRLKEKMREVIQESIDEFHARAEHTCAKCLLPCRGEVDHCGDLEFRHIVEAYLKESPEESRVSTLDAHRFRAFHDARAKLQILCVACHAEKTRLTFANPRVCQESE